MAVAGAGSKVLDAITQLGRGGVVEEGQLERRRIPQRSVELQRANE
jgi:hypothetical protein